MYVTTQMTPSKGSWYQSKKSSGIKRAVKCFCVGYYVQLANRAGVQLDFSCVTKQADDVFVLKNGWYHLKDVFLKAFLLST